MSNHLVSALVRGAPDRVFAELPDGRVFRYRDVAARTAQLAHALVSAGVQPGDRVAVQVDKCLDALLLYVGCARAGAVFLPLNTAYTPPEVAYFVEDAAPAVLVVAPERVDAMAAAAGGAAVWTLGPGGGTLVAAADAAPDAFADVARGPDDLAAILYTSGTTGRSKGAMLTHENLVSNARTLALVWRFTAEDVLIHALPIFHTHGLFVATNVVLYAGASMVLLPRFDADEVLGWMPRATVLMGVPTFYVRLLGHPGLHREAVASMRLFISGSAPLLEDTHRQFAARTGHAILERYGMTETNMNTSNPWEGPRVAGTVGLPLPGVALRITDPATGAELPRGAVGMIEVRGPNVFVGYWRNPEKTAAELRPDGFFITGDLGTVDEAGYVRIVGRGKDLVITGGYNVYPKEVEDEIDALPGVVESAVIGVPHPDLGEGVTAVVVGQTTEAAVLAALDGRLARFKLPKRVIIVDELPRNTMGKVQKAALRAAHAGLYVRT